MMTESNNQPQQTYTNRWWWSFANLPVVGLG